MTNGNKTKNIREERDISSNKNYEGYLKIETSFDTRWVATAVVFVLAIVYSSEIASLFGQLLEQ